MIKIKMNAPWFSPKIWVVAVMLVFSLLFFSKATRHDWIFSGDTLNTLGMFSYQYSGFARGEYPIWNPLVRTGEPEDVQQALFLASPVCNLVVALSVLVGVKDIVLSCSIFIFTLILLYTIGVYLLMSCWTNNRYTGAIGAILAIGSSSVFFYAYHVSFIIIIHAIPWMLYAATAYFREFKFGYLIIFALAYNSAMYSYEFVMTLAYLIMLSIAAVIIYYRQLLTGFRELKKIPFWHVIVMCVILLIMTLPAAFVFMDMQENLLPLSRLTGINVTDQYSLTYGENFTKLFSSSIFGPYHEWSLRAIKASSLWEGHSFWVTFFTGKTNFAFHVQSLRHYVGPVVVPFLVIGLFSFKRSICIMALSCLLVAMLAENVYPASLFWDLPLFDKIRNIHFFLQYMIFSIIVIAAFGFDLLMKKDSKVVKFVFNVSGAVVLVYSVATLFSHHPALSEFDKSAMLLSSAAALLLLIFVNLSSKGIFIISILVVALVGAIGSNFLIDQRPVTPGMLNTDPYTLNLRNRTDHSLKYSPTRPDDIKQICKGYLAKGETDFGMDEFSSYVTLEDNSYKTKPGEFGLSSFPVLKTYYLFLSLPGHEHVMRNKVFFFDQVYISRQPRDMMAFKSDPGLLEAMLERGIGLVDQLNNNVLSLGPFKPNKVRSRPVNNDGKGFSVAIKEFNANNVRMTVAVDRAGIFTHTDCWDKNWRVWLNGQPVPLRKVFYTYKGVELCPGVHEIEFVYRSRILISILMMNALFVFGIIGVIVMTQFHNKKGNAL